MREEGITCMSLCCLGDSANAVPHYQKLRTRVTHIWGDRRGQPNRSAMERPHPGRTAFLITVSPVPGKYEFITARFWHIITTISRIMVFSLLRRIPPRCSPLLFCNTRLGPFEPTVG